jgi:hypothetical protein
MGDRFGDPPIRLSNRRNPMRKIVNFAAAAALVFVATFASAAYFQTVFNDGTNLYAWSATSTNAAMQVNGTTAYSIDVGSVSLVLPISTVAGLPTCNTAAKGAQRMVSDASSPTYNGSLTGSSTTITKVFCNGTNWLSD